MPILILKGLLSFLKYALIHLIRKQTEKIKKAPEKRAINAIIKNMNASTRLKLIFKITACIWRKYQDSAL